MHLKVTVSAIALGFAATTALAQDAETFSSSAGVALLSPEQTGFMRGAQVGVNGVGSAAATVSKGTAVHGFVGRAESGIVSGVGGPVVSDSGTLGTFTFDRDVTVNGSLVGVGTVMAQGEATGASGFTGSAFGDGSNGITFGEDALTSSATSESEAALSGSVSTMANLELIGAESRFASGNGTTVSESNEAVAYSGLGVSAGFGNVQIPGLVFNDGNDATVEAYERFTGVSSQNPDGVAFAMDSELAEDIDLSVSNAGGGSTALSAQTGGFFDGGSSAFGEFEVGGTGAAGFFGSVD